MLRVIVIALVVANLLLLGFQSSQTPVEVEPVNMPPVINNPDIPTIHLLSELMQDEDLLSGNRHCFTLGPFHDVEDKDAILARLRDASAIVSERQTEALVEKGYWVYMPPYISLLEANRELLSLKALGLEDIGIIYDGDWQNAISLGYFLRQENALRRKKDLETKGFAPQMRIQRQTEPRYWLDYELIPGSDLIEIDLRDRPNDFMRRSMPCAEQIMSGASEEETQVPSDELIQEVPVIQVDREL